MNFSHMIMYNLLILALWLILWTYWAVAARRAKRNISGGLVWWREIGLRLGIFLLILIVVRTPALNRELQAVRPWLLNTNTLMGYIGAGICALGIGYALWARVYLDRNWGMPMAQKENAELVTTGPYAHVRHPIYAGMLLAMLGSALGQSPVWLIAFILAGAYFTYSAQREEKLLREQFPEQYPAYMKRTKKLVPFMY